MEKPKPKKLGKITLYRLSETWVDNVKNSILCVQFVKKHWDVPDDINVIDLVAYNRAVPDAHRIRWNGWYFHSKYEDTDNVYRGLRDLWDSLFVPKIITVYVQCYA